MNSFSTPSAELTEHAVSRLSMREMFIDFLAGVLAGDGPGEVPAGA